jgi:hypothetical protein
MTLDGLVLIGPVIDISEQGQPSYAWGLIHGGAGEAHIDCVTASDERLAGLLREVAADALVRVCEVEVFDTVAAQIERALEHWADVSLFAVPGGGRVE